LFALLIGPSVAILVFAKIEAQSICGRLNLIQIPKFTVIALDIEVIAYETQLERDEGARSPKSQGRCPEHQWKQPNDLEGRSDEAS
jgi:hypothetical protein